MTGQDILNEMTPEARAALDPETRKALEENRIQPIEVKIDLTQALEGDVAWLQ